MQHFDSWNDLMLLSKIHNHTTHELYTKLKKHELRFIDEFIQFTRRQEPSRLVNKRATPLEDGYTPNYKTITKVQVEDIIFDEQTTPSLFGKIKSGRGYARITISLEFSELNQILMSSDELGVEISNHIKKRLANPAAEKPTVIDITC